MSLSVTRSSAASWPCMVTGRVIFFRMSIMSARVYLFSANAFEEDVADSICCRQRLIAHVISQCLHIMIKNGTGTTSNDVRKLLTLQVRGAAVGGKAMFAIGSRARIVCMVEFGVQASMSFCSSAMLPELSSPALLPGIVPEAESFKVFPGSNVGVSASSGIAIRSSNVSF
jgi:hypothetical protein